MAIKPVEYVKDSSTAGFAVAGDEKTITKSNANTIKKDVDQGNTEDLNDAQETYLDGKVDYETIDYNNDEMYNVGSNLIDADNTEGAKNINAVGTMAGSTVGAAAGGAANAIGTAVHGNMIQNANNKVLAETAKGLKLDPSTGKISQTNGENVQAAAKNAEKTSKIPFGAVIAGGIALAGAAMGMVSVNKFDDQYNERISKRDSAEEANTTMQQYMETLIADMEMMNEDVTTYSELSDNVTQAKVDTITEVAALQAELQVYQAQGNSAKVAELKAQIAELQKGAEDSNKDPLEEMNNLKSNIDTYSANNAEATGVRDSGSSVSEFLKGGKGMGAQAAIQATMLTVSALLMLKGTINAVSAAFKAPLLSLPAAIACSIAGSAMLVAANVTTGIAAYKMFDKMKNEFDCSNAGDNMSGYVNDLTSEIDGQADYIGSVSGEYTETDEVAAELVNQNQEAANKANGKNEGGKTSRDKSGVTAPSLTNTSGAVDNSGISSSSSSPVV